METTHPLSCPYCGRIFTRQDHLDRHKLSHGEAKYRCGQASCGMLFHRRDVLHRHERVHQHDPSKRRRRPRRGTTPKPFISSIQLGNSGKDQPDQSESRIGKSSDSQSSASPAETLPSTTLPLASFDFCFVHYVQACVRRWPFIHHTWLDGTGMSREKQLAIAALGGCDVAEYRKDASAFFQEARRLLGTRDMANNALASEPFLPFCVEQQSGSALELFQTHVLLLEYALWHASAEATQWAIKTTFEIAAFTIPRMIVHLKALHQSERCWKEWVHEEQCIRVLWAFYCLVQKSIHHYPCFLSTLNMQLDLRLPQSDILFSALDEQAWSQCRHELFTNGIIISELTLRSALYTIQSHRPSESTSLSSLTPLARHVVLAALLDMYTSGVKHLLPDNDQIQNEASRLTSVNCSDSFSKILRTARSLWHTNPVTLFSSIRCVDLQNVLLLYHLETLILTRSGADRKTKPSSRNLCAAARIATDVLLAIHENGMLDVLTRAPWFTDSASKYYVISFARVMIRWINSLQTRQLSVSGSDIEGHTALQDRLRKFLEKQENDHGGINRDLTLPQQFKEAVMDAWTIILRCPPAKWCGKLDP